MLCTMVAFHAGLLGGRPNGVIGSSLADGFCSAARGFQCYAMPGSLSHPWILAGSSCLGGLVMLLCRPDNVPDTQRLRWASASHGGG